MFDSRSVHSYPRTRDDALKLIASAIAAGFEYVEPGYVLHELRDKFGNIAGSGAVLRRSDELWTIHVPLFENPPASYSAGGQVGNTIWKRSFQVRTSPSVPKDTVVLVNDKGEVTAIITNLGDPMNAFNTQLANIERLDLDEAVKLSSEGRAYEAEYEHVGTEAPSWLTDGLKSLRRDIRSRLADTLDKRRMEIQSRLKALATPEEKRKALQEELAAIDRQMGNEPVQAKVDKMLSSL